MKRLFFTLTTVLILLFSGCLQNQGTDQAATVQISAQFKNVSKSKNNFFHKSRTVFPEFNQLSTDNFSTFNFYSKYDENNSLNLDQTKNTLEELNDAMKGYYFGTHEWIFKLEVIDINGNTYSDSYKKSLSPGQNDLSFELKPDAGYGTLEAKLYFTGEADYANIIISGNEYPLDILEDSSGKYVYYAEESIPYGDRDIQIVFEKNNVNLSTNLNMYQETFKIFPGITTSVTKTIKLNPVYTITYEADGGSLADGEYQYNLYTRKSDDITLPQYEKSGFVFDGWHEKSDYSDEAVTQIPTGSTGNKTFYAKWVLDSTTYYVSNSSSASDIFGNGSQAKPFETIKRAVTAIGLQSILNTTNYTILVDGTITGAQEVPLVLFGSLTICGAATTTDTPTDVIDGNEEDTSLIINSTRPVTIKNLKITNGKQNGILACLYSNVTLSKNCVITQNGNNSSTGGNGGGINISSNATLTLEENALIQGNSALNGGGISTLYTTAIIIKDSATISENTANNGSAIYLQTGSHIELQDSCNITNTTTNAQDIFFTDTDNYIKILGDLTYTQAPVTMNSGTYTEGRTILKADSTALLTANYTKFSVSDSQWSIDSTGSLKKKAFAIYLSAEDSNDSYDGLTKGTAVQSFNQALNLINTAGEQPSYTIIVCGDVSCQNGTIQAFTNTNISKLTIMGETDADTDKLNGGNAARVLNITCSTPIEFKNLQICNGAINGASEYGAGILIDNAAADITFTSCKISNNNAENTSGAGIAFIGNSDDSSKLKLLGTEVSNNKIKHSSSVSTFSGAGIYIANSKTTLTISGNSIITNNTIDSSELAIPTASPSDQGAGLWLGYQANTTIGDNTQISNNQILSPSSTSITSSSQGGGIYFYGGVLMISGDVIFDNNIANSGGAIASVYNSNLTGSNLDTVIYENVKFKNNKALVSGTSYGLGGAIYNEGNIYVHGTVIFGNEEADSIATASVYSNYAEEGAGIYNNGTVYLGYNYHREEKTFSGGFYQNYANYTGGAIKNNNKLYIASGNYCYNGAKIYGGALHCYMNETSSTTSQSYLSGGTFQNNITTDGNDWGSAIYFEEGTLDLSKDIYFSNENTIKLTSVSQQITISADLTTSESVAAYINTYNTPSTTVLYFTGTGVSTSHDKIKVVYKAAAETTYTEYSVDENGYAIVP